MNDNLLVVSQNDQSNTNKENVKEIFYKHNLLSILFSLFSIIFFAFSILYFNKTLSEHLNIFNVISATIFIFVILFFVQFSKTPTLWPNLIIGVGTFGTFLGIFLALQKFELPSNVNLSFDILLTSLSSVIGSIKFVFATSIIGIGTSILLRAVYGVATKGIIKQDLLFEKLVFDIDQLKTYSKMLVSKQDYQIDYKTLCENINNLNNILNNVMSFQVKYFETIEKSEMFFNTLQDKIKAFENTNTNQYKNLERYKEITDNIIKTFDDLKKLFDSTQTVITKSFETKFEQTNKEIETSLLQYKNEFLKYNNYLIDKTTSILNSLNFSDKMDSFNNSLLVSMASYKKFIEENLRDQTQLFIKALLDYEKTKVSFVKTSVDNNVMQ